MNDLEAKLLSGAITPFLKEVEVVIDEKGAVNAELSAKKRKGKIVQCRVYLKDSICSPLESQRGVTKKREESQGKAEQTSARKTN